VSYHVLPASPSFSPSFGAEFTMAHLRSKLAGSSRLPLVTFSTQFERWRFRLGNFYSRQPRTYQAAAMFAMRLASFCLTRQHMKGNTSAKWQYHSKRQMFLFLHLPTCIYSLIEFVSFSSLYFFLPFLPLSIYYLPPSLSPAPSISTPTGCVISHYKTAHSSLSVFPVPSSSF
jgi:hypothetical protein